MVVCAPKLEPAVLQESRWTLTPIAHGSATPMPALLAIEEPVDAGNEADTQPFRGALKLGLAIMGVLTVAAAIVAFAVLDAALILLGFFVALSMMTFIGLPLILASIADSADVH